MSDSDSVSNFTISSDSDDDLVFPVDLYENMLFYLICQEPSSFKMTRKSTGRIDRDSSINFINSWSDSMFYRQFRTDREDFNNLLDLMIAGYPGPFADGSSNLFYANSMADKNYGHIPLQIKLYITLRMLSGASYLDMIWYKVDVDSVTRIFKFCVSLINKVDKQINMPTTESDWMDLAAGWSRKSVQKFGFDLMPGTVLAGDGLVIEIEAPPKKYRENIDLANFRNRHGYYAVVCQAFCDVHTRFKYFEVSWPGSTSDITAYKQTALYRAFCDGEIPTWAHMVLDEIYSSIGGDQHLTPYSRNQLRNAKRRRGNERYLQMKAFNNSLSSKYIVL